MSSVENFNRIRSKRKSKHLNKKCACVKSLDIIVIGLNMKYQIFKSKIIVYVQSRSFFLSFVLYFDLQNLNVKYVYIARPRKKPRIVIIEYDIGGKQWKPEFLGGGEQDKNIWAI